MVSWSRSRKRSPNSAVYRRNFQWHYGRGENGERIWLDLGAVGALAQVKVNGQDCGVAWTPPYRVEVTAAVKEGRNAVDISVVNTWRNRRVGDSGRPAEQRGTWTNAKDLPADTPLLPAGLPGPVTLQVLGTEPGASPTRPEVVFHPAEIALRPAERQRIYDEVKTPFKRGIILQPGPDELFDCPSVAAPLPSRRSTTAEGFPAIRSWCGWETGG